MSNLLMTDSPNCETKTANRTLQTGSLTVPADGDRINFVKADLFIEIRGNFVVTIATENRETSTAEMMTSVLC